MRILMLGWEFPPYFVGGLGIACYELTSSLLKIDDMQITYMMPYGPGDEKKDNFTLRCANNISQSKIEIKNIKTLIKAYDTQYSYEKRYEILKSKNNFEKEKSLKEIYGENILDEVYLYAKRVEMICETIEFDVIHAHDWTSIPAALTLKKISGKPVALHVHITELDKTGGMGGHDEIFKIEKMGFEQADVLIAVSNFVKNRLTNDYHINENKIKVVHNGGISDLKPTLEKLNFISKDDRIVLSAGRITLQKGPEYFIRVAKKVLEYAPNTKFIMAGTGDMMAQMIELTAELGMGKNILFHGFYTRADAEKLFSIADIFVMPSVSEPFGIVPLEAIAKGTPTIISKQSGISEVLENCFKVDFWDIDEMAHKIIALLKYEPLHSHMRELAHKEFVKFSWDIPAQKIHNIYGELISKNSNKELMRLI